MDDIKALAPDTVVNLGDCVSGPLEAAETADLLISLAWTTVAEITTGDSLTGRSTRWALRTAPHPPN